MRTIAAISTPPGEGGIGIVRISGADAQKIADRVFHSVSGKKIESLPGYTSLFGTVSDGKETFDQCVASNFCAPKSYTGENVVELSCHGGPFLLRKLLSACYAAGARPAEPGEFTKQAFLNGKMDLTQAESVMEMIGAKSEGAARAARAGQSGKLHESICKVKDELMDAASHLAAWADYPDDDVPQVDNEVLKKQLSDSTDRLQKLYDGFGAGQVLCDGIDTVIVGRPNVGKSTLMNLLSGTQKSIVTAFAGTTRDIVEDTISLGGIPLHLADTAGLRESSDPIEQIGVERTRERLNHAQLILAVFDSSESLTEEDQKLLQSIGNVPAIAVINKADLQNKLDKEYINKYIKQKVYISALKGEGIEALTDAIQTIFHTGEIDPSAGILFTERQKDVIRRALECTKEARDAFLGGMTLDAVTVSVEGALSAILEFTGERVTDAVVEEVFKNFCVGK